MIGAKLAQQDRSRKTLESLLDAMDELLRSTSFSEITIAALAMRAGLSPAAIYKRFSNQDALVSILIELYTRKVPEWATAPENAFGIAKSSTLREALRRLGQQNWAMAEQLGYLIAPAYLQWELRPHLREEAWFDLRRKAQAGIAALLGLFPEELGAVNREDAAEALSVFANMMLVARLLNWPTTGSALPQTGAEYGELIADFGCGFITERARHSRS